MADNYIDTFYDIESIPHVRSFLNKFRLAVAILFSIILAPFIYFWYVYGPGDVLQIIGMGWLCLAVLYKYALALYNICRTPKYLTIPLSVLTFALYVFGTFSFFTNLLGLDLDHSQMRWLIVLTFFIDVLLWLIHGSYYTDKAKELKLFNQKEEVEVVKIAIKN